MNSRTGRLSTGVLIAVAFVLLVAPAALAGKSTRVEVTVTNLTGTQIFSPPIVVAHDNDVALFTPGQPASRELAAVADDADASGLLALLGTMPDVAGTAIGDAPIPPGHSATVILETDDKADRLSVIGMLVTTNDAFYFVNAPLGRGGMLTGVAWDAGS